MRQFHNTPTGQHREYFEPLPAPTGAYPYHRKLSDVIDTSGMTSMVVHTCGDTGGVMNPEPQKKVTELMLKTDAAPTFLYILGDVVYFLGERKSYYPQFYEPYAEYPAPIFAIPGNHDGAKLLGVGGIDGFVENFCAKKPAIAPDAHDTQRHTMDQPNVHWTLETPFSTWIGLYTNVPEGGYVDDAQKMWIAQELRAAPTDKCLVLCLHHPLLSNDTTHGGSTKMLAMYRETTDVAGRFPNLVLTGHVHNYQRFDLAGVPVIVAGAGGYHNLHKVKHTDGLLAHNDKLHGFLRLMFTDHNLTTKYLTVDGAVVDEFDVKW